MYDNNYMPRILLTKEQKKANKKASGKKWRDNNKAYYKKYNKKYREDNIEEIKEREKEYREEHKEERKEYNKNYKKTPKGKRIQRISKWKRSGMIEPDGGWEAFAEMVENTKNCESCNVELTIDKIMTKTTRCVDHSHITGLFRNVLCHSCNLKLPKGT